MYFLYPCQPKFRKYCDDSLLGALVCGKISSLLADPAVQKLKIALSFSCAIAALASCPPTSAVGDAAPSAAESNETSAPTAPPTVLPTEPTITPSQRWVRFSQFCHLPKFVQILDLNKNALSSAPSVCLTVHALPSVPRTLPR